MWLRPPPLRSPRPLIDCDRAADPYFARDSAPSAACAMGRAGGRPASTPRSASWSSLWQQGRLGLGDMAAGAEAPQEHAAPHLRDPRRSRVGDPRRAPPSEPGIWDRTGRPGRGLPIVTGFRHAVSGLMKPLRRDGAACGPRRATSPCSSRSRRPHSPCGCRPGSAAAHRRSRPRAGVCSSPPGRPRRSRPSSVGVR